MTAVRPTCFSSVLCHNKADAICAACEHENDCGDAAYATLVKLRAATDVSGYKNHYDRERIIAGKEVVTDGDITIKATLDGPPRKPSRHRQKSVELTDEEQALVDDKSLPKKPRQLLKTLFSKGFSGRYVKAILRKNTNPFTNNSPRTMFIACELLLGGGFTRAQLNKTFLETSSMTLGTSHSQVSIVCAALTLMGVTHEDGDKIFKIKED